MRFKFDRFVIDGGRRIILRDDNELHVAPKTLDFLLSLQASLMIVLKSGWQQQRYLPIAETLVSPRKPEQKQG